MPDFIIEEGQDYAGTYFDMGAHDSANDTLLYAEWDVTIEPIKYNIAVDVYNTNSWRVQLYLLSQAGDTLKSLRYKGSSGQKGQFSIGSLDLSDLEAGDFIRALMLTCPVRCFRLMQNYLQTLLFRTALSLSSRARQITNTLFGT